MWRLAAPYAAIGIELASSVVVGALLGHAVDVWRDWAPYGFFFGMGVGCAAAVRALVRLVALHNRTK